MNRMLKPLALLCAIAFVAAAVADEFEDAKDAFKNAGQSASFFDSSVGYAIFPTVAKGGLIIGAAHGDGRVYHHGKHIGDTKLTQVSVGAQAGGQAYSEIIFFQDENALTTFKRGNFELGAGVQAVAITASAGAQTTTSGSSAGASGSQQSAAMAGAYHNGLAVFTLPKGGAMFSASVGGQKFSFSPNKVAAE